MKELRPRQILKDIVHNWPDAWMQIKMIRAEKGKAIPDWPDWCYLPIAAGVAIATQGGPINERCVDARLSPAVITAAAAWRVSQGVYKFDPDLYKSLFTQPLDGNIPCEALKRLPEYCVYIETYNVSFCTIPVEGFWAHLEYDTHNERVELRFVFMCRDGRNMPIAVHLGDWTLEEGLEKMRNEAIKNTPDNYVPVAEYIGNLAPLLQLVLYLCADNADMPNVRHPITRMRPSGMIDAPKEPRVWMVGERIGTAIRQYCNQQVSTCQNSDTSHASPRPHVRRAHWHHYWTGPKNGNRKLILKWLPPIPVGIEDDGPIVIHRVK